MRFLIKKEWRSEHFRDFLLNKSRYQILFGGRGSGKTHHIILKLLALSFLKDYNHIIYVNKIFGHIKKNQFADIVKVIKMLDLKKYFVINKTDYSITNVITQTRFTALGMDDSENTKGISDPTIIWWDEITRGDEEDFNTLNALLRTPLNPKHQFIISFNPVSEKHWVRKYFFDENDAYKINSKFTDYYLNHSTLENNDFIDKVEYKKTLMLNHANNQALMNVNLLGIWGQEQNKRPFIEAKKDNLFNTQLAFNPLQPIWLSWDINDNPLTCLVSQVSFGQHSPNNMQCFIRTFNEITVSPELQMRYNNEDKYVIVAKEIKRLYPNSPIYITGDSSGWQGNPMFKANESSMYLYVCSLLRVNSQTQLKTPKSNLQHTVSQTLINSALSFHPCIQINPNTCPILANEIDIAQMGDDNKLIKNRAEFKLDSFDAWRYLIATILYPYWLTNLQLSNK